VLSEKRHSGRFSSRSTCDGDGNDKVFRQGDGHVTHERGVHLRLIEPGS
jgi:hypothetical protein